MLVSYKWLSQYLDLDAYQAEEIAEKMSRTGIEIEGVENLGSDLDCLKVGHVVEQYPHPDSDHLQITKVDVGDGNLRQIVCGAPNVHQGAKVITALEGCVLPGDFKIKESKLRGELSQGMLCSLQELGFSDNVVPKEYADGIFLLPEDAPLGADIVEYMELNDSVLELDITPNRADALSMHGVAHEVGAIVGQKPNFKKIEAGADKVAELDLLNEVTIEVNPASISPHYQVRLIKNVTIGPSPMWLQMRLMKAGMRPINNIVDATNHFLLLYGQPLHAFDYDALPSKNIKVRMGENGEELVTLDGNTRRLSPEDIVITAGDTPVALAGVMGGLDSHVDETTRNILLEAAVFDAQLIRSTSRKFGLRSEASSRYEKGINEATVSEVAEQASIFMAELGGGQVEAGLTEVNTNAATDVKVTVVFQHVEDKLGIKLTQSELKDIFKRLGFGVEFAETEFTVSVPPRRWDISIEADILEEIARIYGYDNIPATLPAVPSRPAQLNKRQQLIRASRSINEGLGLNETVSYVLVSPEMAKLNEATDYPKVTLLLPMSEDRAMLRQSMLPSMLDIARYNNARHNKPLAFYEIGKVFFGSEDHNKLPLESERMTLLISGEKSPSTWSAKGSQYDFYDLKGMLESYFEAIRLEDKITFRVENELSFMHPGRTARILLDNQYIGFMGQLHPSLAKEFDLDLATFFAEIDLDLIVEYSRPELIQAPLAKYPATSRDLALLVNDTVSHQELTDIIEGSAGPDLVKVDLFDLYQGDNLEKGKQSLAYHLTFQNPGKTLTDEEVTSSMDKIIKALEEIDGLEIR